MPIENSDDIGIERKSETGWTSIGKFNSSGSFTKTNDTSEDEEKLIYLSHRSQKSTSRASHYGRNSNKLQGVDKTKGSYTEIKISFRYAPNTRQNRI